MKFSNDSQVSIVITSCGRLDLLKKTVETLDEYNTHPISKVVITEDSGNENVRNSVPSHWLEHTSFIVNKENLGQLACIDKAYELIDTKYIFHCEDDWEFYRPSFIEDSMAILETQTDIVMVWLRSFYHDIMPRHSFHYLGEQEYVGTIGFNQIKSDSPDWRGFSFNPGLRRLEDYQKVAPVDRFASSGSGESKLSIEYENMGMRAVILNNDAVSHIGYSHHVITNSDLENFKRKKRKRQFKYVLLFLLGIIIGYLVG